MTAWPMKHFHCLGPFKHHRVLDARLHPRLLQRGRESESQKEDGRAFIPRLHLSIRAYPSRLLCVLDLRHSAGGATFHSAWEGGRPAAAATFSGSCCMRTLRRGGSVSLHLPLSLHPEPFSPFDFVFFKGSISASAAIRVVFTVAQWEAAERPSASSHVVWSLASRRARSCTAASCAWRRRGELGGGLH